MLYDLSLESTVYSLPSRVYRPQTRLPKVPGIKNLVNMLKSFSPILVALIMLSLCILTRAAPYQELEPRKGHVPVYIRHGDEALTNIHAGLAEAFNEDSSPPSLLAENLITEVPTQSTEASSTAGAKSSSTESDIASFDAIKAKDE